MSRGEALAAALAMSAMAACGPHIQLQDDVETAWRSDQGCTQGPLEVSLTATGERWGEAFEVYALSPRNICGRWTAFWSHDPDTRWTGHWCSKRKASVYRDGRNHDVLVDAQPQNQRCLQAPPGTLAPATVVHGPPRRGYPLDDRPVTETRPAELVPADFHSSSGDQRVRVFFHHVKTWGPNGDGALEPGLELRVQIWAEAPNDLAGVRFFALHRVGVPSVSEAEYVAHLREEQRESHGRVPPEAPPRRSLGGGLGGLPESAACPSERATRPPPPARTEIRPPQPHPGARWVTGSYVWEGERCAWLWVHGFWQR